MTKIVENNSIGKTLKQKRQELNLDIEFISKKLNIRDEILKNLEEENWHLINKNLYITGLILSYGQILMIDKAIINQQIQDLNIQSNTKNKKHQLVNIGEDPNLTPNKQLFHISIVSGLFLIIISLIFINSTINKENIINYPQLYQAIEISDNENQ